MVQCRLVVGSESKVQVLSPLWRPSPPKPDTPDLFRSLPPELRHRIYGLIIPVGRTFFFKFQQPKKDPPIFALCMAAKYIRFEALPVYYGNNIFIYRMPDTGRSLQAAVEHWRGVVAICGPRPFKYLHFWFGLGVEIEKAHKGMHALVELIHDTGFEPDPGHVQGDAVRLDQRNRSIASATNIFDTGRQRSMAEILGRAVALGRRASYEKWPKQKLAGRMLMFMEVARSKRKKWPAWL